MQKSTTLLFSLLLICGFCQLEAQSVTGVWRGKIKGIQTELKLVKNGDELVGVAYYYQSPRKFKKYSVKGNFDPETNAVIWWDELLLDDPTGKKILQIGPDPQAQMTVADFNCPGSDEMFLDGNSSSRDNSHQQNGVVHLEKKDATMFPDEWDYIIDNYFSGTNDPELIDSVSRYGLSSKIPEEKSLEPARARTAPAEPVNIQPIEVMIPKGAAKPVPDILQDKFSARKNVLQTVIPITASTIELRFYDNAEIDGDSIAIFLNGRLLFKNIRLTDQPYSIQLHADDLQADNELVMVAENLGSIPPNTSYMVAIVGDKRYEARLYANEKSSALVRIVRPENATSPR